MKRLLIGTAGHVDHGKTSLIEALTGTDCDRWEEEKRRGITIDLGFAHLQLGDIQVGFVDVPGHQKFLHNALAGLGGIRGVLLVVAADDGVMPQTTEHLSACRLLGISGALVAITKTDLVEEGQLELVNEEVRDLLARTGYPSAQIVPVSSTAGTGLEDLTAALSSLALSLGEAHDDRQATRLPVDRSFLLKGQGRIATGTVANGTIETGAELVALPGGSRVRVRNIQVHGETRDTAHSGERAALQLGQAEGAQIARGSFLVADQTMQESPVWLARLELLEAAGKPIKRSTELKLFLLSHEVTVRARPLEGPLEPGESGLVELSLASPAPAWRGDRFVVRRPSPPLTIGGGKILDPQWKRLRASERKRVLSRVAGSLDESITCWAALKRDAGIRLAELTSRLGMSDETVTELLDRLVRDGRLIAAQSKGGQAWISPGAFKRVQTLAQEVLSRFFDENRLAKSMPRAAALSQILSTSAKPLSATYLELLEKSGVIQLQGDALAPPGREADLSPTESKLASAVAAAYESAGLRPPAPSAVRAALGAKAQILDGVLQYLVEQGRLVRLPDDLIAAQSAIEQLGQDLVETGWSDFSIGDFKDRFELSRKWAIPLLEHLDSTGVTMRVGNRRKILSR